ncbi:MAG: response regulator transcription factor [Proteobacteria bacterium]|nr:response regulator transcription factor [Pseudomonadota bacterium]
MNILLVDDHVLFRAGMRHLLRQLNDTLELDEASNHAEALSRLAVKNYDLVLLDLGLPDIGGLAALDSLRLAATNSPIVVISADEDAPLVHAAIEHGAMGFIPKSSTPELLIHALGLVLARGIYLPQALLDKPPAGKTSTQPHDETPPSPRIISGKSNKAIAQELNLSDATVKAHLTLTFRSLGVSSRTEAIYAAAKLGLRLA